MSDIMQDIAEAVYMMQQAMIKHRLAPIRGILVSPETEAVIRTIAKPASPIEIDYPRHHKAPLARILGVKIIEEPADE